jgi:hypothetical protein
MSPIVTRDSIQSYLDNPEKTFQEKAAYVGRALVVLFDRQTAGEKVANTTNMDNGIGFTGADGKSGVLSAKSFLKNKTLQDWQLERWLKKGKSGYARIAKYHSQLNEVAVAKAAQRGA